VYETQIFNNSKYVVSKEEFRISGTKKLTSFSKLVPKLFW